MGVGGGWWIADGGQRKGVEGETAAANSNLQVKGVGGGGHAPAHPVSSIRGGSVSK